jgi:hypothetical protein
MLHRFVWNIVLFLGISARFDYPKDFDLHNLAAKYAKHYKKTMAVCGDKIKEFIDLA